MERTLVIFKPDCLARRLLGEIFSRFERKGLTLAGLRLLRFDRALGERLYGEHQGQVFYPFLLDFIVSGSCVIAVWEGREAVKVVRALCGQTRGSEATPGTIRGDYSLSQCNNLVHASGDHAAAQREIALFFTPAELLPESPPDPLLYDLFGPGAPR